MSETERSRELSRLLAAHRSGLFSASHWDKLLEAPSKMAVDHVLWTFNSNVRDIHPRTYETFSDIEIRDAICEWLGRPYAELPDSTPLKRDLMFEFALWWYGALGAIAVSAIVVALVRTVFGL